MSRDPEVELLELENKILDAVDAAWEAYQQSGAGMPPPIMVQLFEKAHKMILGRMERRSGSSFDLSKPEEALLKIKSIERLLLQSIEQRNRLRLVKSS